MKSVEEECPLCRQPARSTAVDYHFKHFECEKCKQFEISRAGEKLYRSTNADDALRASEMAAKAPTGFIWVIRRPTHKQKLKIPQLEMIGRYEPLDRSKRKDPDEETDG